MNLDIPVAAHFCIKLAEAKSRELDKTREAVETFLKRFKQHLDMLLANPDKFTSHTCYVEELRGNMYVKGADCSFFVESVKSKLSPLGYRVEKSHDGGGMYETIVVRWDIESKRMGRGSV